MKTCIKCKKTIPSKRINLCATCELDLKVLNLSKRQYKKLNAPIKIIERISRIISTYNN